VKKVDLQKKLSQVQEDEEEYYDSEDDDK